MVYGFGTWPGRYRTVGTTERQSKRPDYWVMLRWVMRRPVWPYVLISHDTAGASHQALTGVAPGSCRAGCRYDMLWGPYNLEKPDWYDWQPQRKTDYRSYQVRYGVLLLRHTLEHFKAACSMRALSTSVHMPLRGREHTAVLVAVNRYHHPDTTTLRLCAPGVVLILCRHWGTGALGSHAPPDTLKPFTPVTRYTVSSRLPRRRVHL